MSWQHFFQQPGQFSVAENNWSQKWEKKKKRFINRAERETQKPESWDQALNLQSLFLSAPPPPQSHVKNYTAAPASKQLQSGVCEWRLCRTGWHCSLTFGEVLTIYSTGFIFRWTGSKSWACSQSPLSVPHDHNYIKYNHSDPNCQLITVAEVNQRRGWEVERNQREEIEVVLARDSVWALWRAQWHRVSVITWMCVQEQFHPRRSWHTHSNACQEATHAWHRESARPWHMERGEATSSSRDGSVPPCHMSVTIPRSHVSLSPVPPPPPPSLPNHVNM